MTMRGVILGTAAYREIFFRQRNSLRVVATRLGKSFEFDATRTLFSFPLVHGNDDQTRSFDVTADGTRILAVRIPDATMPRQIEIVTDWTSQLTRLAPKAK